MPVYQHIPAKPHRSLFENQISCGICSTKMIRKQLPRQNNIRVYTCPACKNNPESPAQSYQYPLHNLMYDVAKAIRRERRTAIRTGVKVLQAQQEQKTDAVQQYYHRKIKVSMDKTRSIVRSINGLFLENPPDEPFSIQTMRKYYSLQMQAEEQTIKTAEWADTLLTFLREFQLENKWYRLYSTIPEDFTEALAQLRDYRSIFTMDNPWLKLYRGKTLPEVMTPAIAKELIEQVLISPQEEVTVKFKHQNWREKLLEGIAPASKKED